MGKVRRTLKRVRLHREGTDILLVTLAFLVSFNVLVWWMSTPAGIAVTVISAILYLLLVNFYRSPKRHFTGRRENVVVSSVDGKVVALEETYESEYLKCRCIQLSVFMQKDIQKL